MILCCPHKFNGTFEEHNLQLAIKILNYIVSKKKLLEYAYKQLYEIITNENDKIYNNQLYKFYKKLYNIIKQNQKTDDIKRNIMTEIIKLQEQSEETNDSNNLVWLTSAFISRILLELKYNYNRQI
jgi:hypothetical protein